MMTALTLKLTPLPRQRQTLQYAVADVLQGIQLGAGDGGVLADGGGRGCGLRCQRGSTG
jgi:hypothetical protein